MQEKEFNLLEEPWIKIIMPSLEQKEVSLTDALVNAQEYTGLSGEMPTQDAAVLRVLLAVALTVFYRYDEKGEEAELSEENDWDTDVLDRWSAYWEMKHFPEQAVRNYLNKYQERFWLFHPETPFWQVKDLQYGTDYDAACLFGNLKESMNKATKHHFSMTDGEELDQLSYGEAARWLIHLNAYAVNVKTDKKASGTLSPVGIGRLGQIGFVMVNGTNLFETIMLNLCALNNGSELWGSPSPVWERELRTSQGFQISTPDNLPELYTIQSRRVMLKRDQEGNLTGFRALGGDFYPIEDSVEPMTIWKRIKKDAKTKEIMPMLPQTHDPAIHAWREFPILFLNRAVEDTERRIPGVVQWMNVLCREKMFASSSLITFKMIGMVYGDKMNYTYGDCVNDFLTISAGLLNEINAADGVWISLISEEVEKCQSVATEALFPFSQKVCKLFYGNAAKNPVRDQLVRQYYFSIDGAFREWLSGIDPMKSSKEEKLMEWEKQSYAYARKTVEDYVATLGTNLYLHREDPSKKGRKELLTIPHIMNEYLFELGKIYKKEEEHSRETKEESGRLRKEKE